MDQLNIFELYSHELDRMKTIRVFLPSTYNTELSQCFDVLYMHDGQNLFDPKTSSYGNHWKVPETLNELEQNNKINGYIVVGIDCNNGEGGRKRLDEYSPWINLDVSQYFGEGAIAGGEGEAYVDFLVHTLKPYIDQHSRSNTNRENTLIAGSSMGGVISLYAGFKFPEIFSKIGAFSTAAWFAKAELFEYIKYQFGKENLKIYLDIGTKEGSDQSKVDFENIYVKDSIELNDLLLNLGQPEENLKFIIDEDAIHNEIAWAIRFPDFIRWISK
jgi:predicted alpha/beta superfamily hydrolase